MVPLKISLSNPNIDVRILAQGNCVTIVGPSFNFDLDIEQDKINISLVNQAGN